MRNREPSRGSGFRVVVRVTPRYNSGNHKPTLQIGARSTQRESNRDPGGRDTCPEVDLIREQDGFILPTNPNGYLLELLI